MGRCMERDRAKLEKWLKRAERGQRMNKENDAR